MTKPGRRLAGQAAGEGTAGGGCATMNETLEYSLFIFLSLFLPSLCWDHYLIQLLFPILAIFAALERRRSWPIGVLVVVSLLVVSLPFNFWSPRWQSGPGLLLIVLETLWRIGPVCGECLAAAQGARARPFPSRLTRIPKQDTLSVYIIWSEQQWCERRFT